MISVFLAHCNLQHVAANAVTELNHVRHELADVDPRTTTSLRVICPVDHGVFIEQPLAKDFRLGAMNYAFIRGIVDAVFEERGLRLGTLSVDPRPSNRQRAPAVLAKSGRASST